MTSTLQLVTVDGDTYAVRDNDGELTVSEFHSGIIQDDPAAVAIIADAANSSGSILPVLPSAIAEQLAYVLDQIIGGTHDADQVAMLVIGALTDTTLQLIERQQEQAKVWPKTAKGGRRGVTVYDLDPAA